ncbi:MAG: methyltransferase domain-containing protein [Thiohalocapsa sp.]
MTLAQRIGDYSSPSSLGSRFRAKRIQPLLEMIARVSDRAGSCSIIDVGGTRKYWSIVPTDFLRERRVSILITNITDNSGDGGGEREDDGVFRHAYADACNLPYPDRSFDILHSNSVIEHVGTWEDQLRFSREATRIAAAYFIQTPNYWFPWEPHFGTLGFQYLPMPWQISLLMRGKRGFRQQAATVDAAVRSIESCRLLDERRFRTLFPDAELQRERFYGLTKSLIAIRRPPG